MYKSLKTAPDAKYTHTLRWYIHIASYLKEHDSLPGSSNSAQKFTQAGAAPKTEAAGDDDDIDLFGDDDEEDEEAERIKAERVKAYEAKKANKPKAAAKVGLVSLRIRC